eukprot:3936208-Rhodomonas_salina.1
MAMLAHANALRACPPPPQDHTWTRGGGGGGGEARLSKVEHVIVLTKMDKIDNRVSNKVRFVCMCVCAAAVRKRAVCAAAVRKEAERGGVCGVQRCERKWSARERERERVGVWVRQGRVCGLRSEEGGCVTPRRGMPVAERCVCMSVLWIKPLTFDL